MPVPAFILHNHTWALIGIPTYPIEVTLHSGFPHLCSKSSISVVWLGYSYAGMPPRTDAYENGLLDHFLASGLPCLRTGAGLIPVGLVPGTFPLMGKLTIGRDLMYFPCPKCFRGPTLQFGFVFAAANSPPIVPHRTTVAENRDFRPLKGVFGKNLLKSKNPSQNTGFFVTPKFSGVNSIKYALKAIFCLIR